MTMTKDYYEGGDKVASVLAADFFKLGLDVACLGDFATRLMFKALLPLGMLAGVLLCGAVVAAAVESRRRCQSSGADETPAVPPSTAALASMISNLPLTLVVLFSLLPTVSQRIFSTFSCEPFGYDDAKKAERFFMFADYAVECADGSSEYDKLVGLAGGLIVLWPIGVPLFFFVLLLASRFGHSTELAKAVEFLHLEYKEHCFFWEVRRLLLRGPTTRPRQRLASVARSAHFSALTEGLLFASRLGSSLSKGAS